ncbi:MAG: glycosyltransferase family 4 protein [Bacteroidales bacterium]|nr:glycosyltransferase family 4 protein [Bacteroidales bacterium]
MQSVCFITPNSDTFTNPTLSTMFHYFKDNGITVHLFGPQQMPQCPDNLDNVKCYDCTFKMSFKNPKYWCKQYKAYSIVGEVIKSNNIKNVYAVDPLGLIIGGRVKKYLCKDVKLCYLSFEIFFKEELSGYYLTLKNKEIKYSKLIDSLLVQDDVRKDLLFAENGFTLSDNKVALIPVSPEPIEVKEAVDIHERFGIDKSMKLAVYSGSLGKWCGTDAIIEAFDKGYWPAEYHLVFHTRRPLNEGDAYYNDIMRLANNPEIPFTLHAHPFEAFEDLAAFLKGFDLALALYYPNFDNPYYGKNMQEIGLSSGKFSMYMMLGLPTIVTACKTYNELIKKYKFGAVIEEVKELKDVMNKAYSKEVAERMYKSVLVPHLTEIDKTLCLKN